jgi:hypothetical protein
MKFYTVHAKPGDGPEKNILIREGFSWPGFFFGPLWLGLKGAWIGLAIALFFIIGAGRSDGELAYWISLAVPLVIGFEGNDLWRNALDKKGYEMKGYLAAHNLDEAELHMARTMIPQPAESPAL